MSKSAMIITTDVQQAIALINGLNATIFAGAEHPSVSIFSTDSHSQPASISHNYHAPIHYHSIDHSAVGLGGTVSNQNGYVLSEDDIERIAKRISNKMMGELKEQKEYIKILEDKLDGISQRYSVIEELVQSADHSSASFHDKIHGNVTFVNSTIGANSANFKRSNVYSADESESLSYAKELEEEFELFQQRITHLKKKNHRQSQETKHLQMQYKQKENDRFAGKKRKKCDAFAPTLSSTTSRKRRKKSNGNTNDVLATNLDSKSNQSAESTISASTVKIDYDDKIQWCG